MRRTTGPVPAVLVAVAQAPAGETGAPAGETDHAAVRTAVVDAVLDALSAAGGPGHHVGVRVLVRVDGRPRTVLDVPLPLVLADVDALLARSPLDRPAPAPGPAPAPARPTVAVVVPTVVGRVEGLDRLLTSLAALDGGPVEVVLVDNRPAPPAGDALPGLLARHPGVRCVREPRPGISAARNAGAAATDADVVAFTDDDVDVDPGWVEALAARFAAHPDELAVTGLVVPAELETTAQLQYEAHYGGFGGVRVLDPVRIDGTAGSAVALVRTGTPDVPPTRMPVYGVGAYGAGANMAFRRRELLARGGFDPHLGTGTPARGGEDLAALVDVLWTGGSIGYEPAALVHHTHRRDVPRLERQLHGNGVGFTAMLCSLVAHDHRHATALAALVPAAVGRLAVRTLGRLRRPEATAPAGADDHPVPALPPVAVPAARFAVLELSGFPVGPAAYVRSRRRGTLPVPAASRPVSPASRPVSPAPLPAGTAPTGTVRPPGSSS